MRLIDADGLLKQMKPRGISDEIWRASTIYESIVDFPTIPTKQVKYFDEDERVWKIGSVIVDERLNKTE